MKISHSILAISSLFLVIAAPAYAEPTSVLDISSMPSKDVLDGFARLTPLAFNDEKKPSVVLLRLKKGANAKTAHVTKDGRIRFATVLSGTLFYADGEIVDRTKEVAYPVGSMLLIPPGTKHWVAAHNDDVILMLTAVKPENLSPAVSHLRGDSGENKEKAIAQLMNAISKNDYEAFIENGTQEFRSSITKNAFTSLTSQVSRLIKSGYKLVYLSELNQQEFNVHLWKISYEGSKENSLAKLAMSNGKVAGFWLQ